MLLRLGLTNNTTPLCYVNNLSRLLVDRSVRTRSVYDIPVSGFNKEGELGNKGVVYSVTGVSRRSTLVTNIDLRTVIPEVNVYGTFVLGWF